MTTSSGCDTKESNESSVRPTGSFFTTPPSSPLKPPSPNARPPDEQKTPPHRDRETSDGPELTPEQRRKNTYKAVALYGGLVGAMIVMSIYVPALLYEYREPVRALPVGAVIPSYLLISYLRYSLIFPYYFFPVGSFYIWFIAVKYGPPLGSLVLVSSWAAIYLACNPTLRLIWTTKISKLLDGTEQLWYMPNTLKMGILGLDFHWKNTAHGTNLNDGSRRLPAQQAALVVLLDNAYGTGGIMFSQIWIATRTQIAWITFAAGTVISLALYYPRGKVILATVEELTADPNNNIFIDGIRLMFKEVLNLTIPEIIIVVGVPWVATLYYQGSNIRLFCRWASMRWRERRSRREKVETRRACSSSELRESTGDREPLSPDKAKCYGTSERPSSETSEVQLAKTLAESLRPPGPEERQGLAIKRTTQARKK